MDNGGVGVTCNPPIYGYKGSTWEPVLAVYERVSEGSPAASADARGGRRRRREIVFGGDLDEPPAKRAARSR